VSEVPSAGFRGILSEIAMMGVYVRIRGHGRGSLVAGVALAAGMIGWCAVCGDTVGRGASLTRPAPQRRQPGSGGEGLQRETLPREPLQREALRLAALGRTVDWRNGDVPLVRLRGEVLMNGQPVAGADVRIAAPPRSIEVTATTTDDEGRFDLGYQDPRGVQVVARRGEGRGIRSIDLGEQLAVGRVWLNVDLAPCEEWVTGRLVDREGRPLAGVPLHEDVRGWWPILAEAGHSARDGSFRVCGEKILAGGGSLALVKVGGPDAGDVVLERPFTIRGRVIRTGGKPVDAANVDVMPSRDDGPRVIARSDRSGAWSAEVAAGCVELRARHRGECAQLNRPGEHRHCFDPRPLEICGKPGDTVLAPPIVLPRCNRVVRGVVRVGLEPAAGVQIWSGHQRDLTDALGRFSFVCPSDPVVVTGHDVIGDPVLVSGHVVEVVAVPSPWIHGRVTMAGHPIRGASVRVTDERSLLSQVVAVTDSDGSYAAQVPASTISIAADGPGGMGTAPRVVDSPGGTQALHFDLEIGTRPRSESE